MISKNASFIMVLLAVVSALPCLGQVERGGISGFVVDPTGASMAKVKVSATNQATGAVARVETTDDGYYKIPFFIAAVRPTQ